ncbi:hypothetical protein [Streptacidiphilus rugosus]|uniref:hypothetical protein n=1 Tax=Streptacidiphilus rugosus TaxID=405783 RepID=UPI00055EDA69|nr:hypothetical protein [Streptacidiphilus rugosus]
MGASGWSYVAPYRRTVVASLEALQQEVFAQEYGDGEEYSSVAELYADEEFMAEEGTHSILDVRRVVESTALPQESNPYDYFTVRPLAPARLVVHFGTDRPTVRQFEDALARSYTFMQAWRPGDEDTSLLGEHEMRWTGFYVLLHTDDATSHVGFFGASGD